MKKLKSDCFLVSRPFMKTYIHIIDSKSLGTNVMGPNKFQEMPNRTLTKDSENFIKEFSIKNSVYSYRFFFNKKIRNLFYEE